MRIRLSAVFALLVSPIASVSAVLPPPETHYFIRFAETELGRVPSGWSDVIDRLPNPSWAVDGQGFLRPMAKGYSGVVACERVLDERQVGAHDVTTELTFKKSIDETVSIGLLAGLLDERNYHALRFSGMDRLELLKVEDGVVRSLTSHVSLNRYLQETTVWRLRLSVVDGLLTGRLLDAQGREQARVDARAEKPLRGRFGIGATTYAAAESFTLTTSGRLVPQRGRTGGSSVEGSEPAVEMVSYRVLRPRFAVDELNTDFAALASRYDVVVAGGGTGGWAAAVQAARTGASVLLVEESDWLGGQMSAAGVTSMDEAGVWFQYPVRERGLYREFHESITNYYYTLNKDPYRAYYAWPAQTEGGYEPKVTRALQYAFIADTRSRATQSGRTPVLDVVTGTSVEAVTKEGRRVTGVTLRKISEGEVQTRHVASHVLVDATEYGDLLPKAGVAYRVGLSKSAQLKRADPLQDHTWLAIIREYPDGVPEHLQIKEPPPRYERLAKAFGHQLDGVEAWGVGAKGLTGPRHWRVFMAWRGMADTESPLTGVASERRHTQAGMNSGGQDYPTTVATVEDESQRFADEREGIYRTLSVLYYFQQVLGLPWSVAEDEGYDTAYNRQKMRQRGIRGDLLPLAVRMPQWPYVREARRMVGYYTLKAGDMGRFERARLFPTSLAMGDYYIDLHRTEEQVETDLDGGTDYDRGEGPYQVPFEAFIPVEVDGFVPAEKNIAQSRLVNGATRLQPSTMLIGQAAGALAGMAALERVQPRQLNPLHVQRSLLESGSTLIPRYYTDVRWGTPLWRATQLLSLHGILDRPGPIVRKDFGPLREQYSWGKDEPVTAHDFNDALSRLTALVPEAKAPRALADAPTVSGQEAQRQLAAAKPAWAGRLADAGGSPLTRESVALILAELLVAEGVPSLTHD